MRFHPSGKTPRSPAADAAPDAEPAAAPASEVPPGTVRTDGDGEGGGDDLGEAAASPTAQQPPGDDGGAEELDAEAAAALLAATQTMPAAGLADPLDQILNAQDDLPSLPEESASEDDDEAVPAAQAKGKGKATATSSVPRRTSSRVKGKAPESDGGPPDVPDGGESAASGLSRAASRANDLGQDDDGDDDDEEDAPSSPVATGPGGSLAVLAESAAVAAVPPGARVQKKDQHPSGVWGVYSPTGYPVAKERVAAMDHTDGKPWEVEVWSMLEDPEGGNEEVNFQSVARFYEQKTRAIMTVPHMGKMKDDDLTGIEPHDRMFPTGFYQPMGDFKGMILSCIDLVYCDGADKATPYDEWRGTRFIPRLRPIPNGSSPRSARATTSS